MGLYSIIGGEKSKKLGYSLIKTLILLKFYTKTPNTLTIWVENSEKSDFSLETGTNFRTLFLQISACGYILVQLLRQLFFSTQTEVGIFPKSFSCKNIHNHCRKHENSPNSSSYTIEYKSVRKFSPIISKLSFFLKHHSNCSTNKRNCSHTKLSKQQLTAHASIVKGYMVKCYKHAPFSSKCTIVVTGVRKSTNISAQNTEQINLAYIVNYNENISKWLVLLVQKAAFP